jgi:hypothetical protein
LNGAATRCPNGIPFHIRYHIREAGSTAVQEIAFTLSNGKAYVKAAIEKGLDINVLARDYRSSSMRIIIYLKRWQSSGRPGECGRTS